MSKKYRAIQTKTLANKTKIQQLTTLLPHWREGLKLVLSIQTSKIKQGKKIGWLSNKDYPGEKPPNYLRARQWNNIVNQVNNDLNTWRALITKRVRPRIYGLDIPPEERRDLFRLNLNSQWYKDKRLAKIIEDLLKDHPLPTYENTSIMLMDNLIAPIQSTRKKTIFKGWVRFTMPTTAPIYLPLIENPYLDAAPGESKLIQVKVLSDEEVTLRVVKVSEKSDPVMTTEEEIGIDWGLKNLITTSTGRLYGSHLYAWLVERDQELTELVKSLQASGVKKLNRSRRYRRFNHRIREYVANEVGRIINLLKKEELKYITVEELDFRGGGLSRRLNRIVSRAGRRVLRQRLRELEEETGTQVVSVPAYYSSQECSSCGYVDRRSRKSQSRFECKFCGYKSHADVNASRVVRGRRSVSSFTSVVGKEDALEVLDRSFTQRWGISIDQYRERSTLRPSSRADRGLAPV